MFSSETQNVFHKAVSLMVEVLLSKLNEVRIFKRLSPLKRHQKKKKKKKRHGTPVQGLPMEGGLTRQSLVPSAEEERRGFTNVSNFKHIKGDVEIGST